MRKSFAGVGEVFILVLVVVLVLESDFLPGIDYLPGTQFSVQRPG